MAGSDIEKRDVEAAPPSPPGERIASVVDQIPGVDDPDADKTPEEKREAERKLLRQLDMKLIPWLSFLYLICFLDRTNIGNAKIAHLTKDIPMTVPGFNDTLTIFFIGYAVFEALANFLLKRWRPSVFIPAIMILWGACMLCMGFVTNWSGLMAARFFLGVTEAGLFPGINYYLSCWYKRSEFGVRAAIFFSAAAISGSFGGLLAAAIQNMDGVANRPGWSWIFILEGLLTVVIGLISFWMVYDFPDEAKFLSVEDRARVLLRLKRDQQSSAEHEDFKWGYLKAALTDWKTYMGMFLYMGPLMPLYSFSLFLPTIIVNMGFTASENIIKNQLLSVPPYVAAAILTVVMGFWSDRIKRRGIFCICLAPLGVLGFSMLIASQTPGVQYAGTFLGALAIYPLVPLIIVWIANNTEGVYKRGIVLGFVIGWGNLNGVVSSNIWQQGPRFYSGHATVIAYMFCCIFLGSIFYVMMLRAENKKRREGKRDYLVANKTPEEVAMLGDKRPDFQYTL